MLPNPQPLYNSTFLSSQELEARIVALGDVGGVSRILAAYDIAKSVHEGMTRNDGTPYFWHCTRVARILIDETGITDADVITASLIHDVLEDSSSVTRSVLEYNFGMYVAYLVETLTKDLKRAQIDPDIVDLDHVDKLRRSSYDCLAIKLASRLDNMRCLEYHLKRNPLIYIKNTLERYLPLAEESGNEKLLYMSHAIRAEANKFLG